MAKEAKKSWEWPGLNFSEQIDLTWSRFLPTCLPVWALSFLLGFTTAHSQSSSFLTVLCAVSLIGAFLVPYYLLAKARRSLAVMAMVLLLNLLFGGLLILGYWVDHPLLG